MIVRLLLILRLITTLSVPAIASPTADPQATFSVVDKFITMQSEKAPEDAKAKMLAPTAKAAYLSKAISLQILSLEPEDFNLFLFYFMDRYIHKPDERKVLFKFLESLRGMMEADLNNTAMLKDGPEAMILEGTYTYGTWILLGGTAMLGWRAIVSNPMRSGTLVNQMAQREASQVRSNSLVRYGTRLATGAGALTVASAAVGGIAGYLEYVMKTHRTHRLDPIQLLMVVQAQLACQVSYDTLQLADRLENDEKDDETLKRDGKALLEALTTLNAQAKVLLEQFPWLSKLTVNDRIFQQTLAAYPKAQNWQEYRKILNESPEDRAGQCRAMSLERVTRKLDEMTDSLYEDLPDLKPKAPDAPTEAPK